MGSVAGNRRRLRVLLVASGRLADGSTGGRRRPGPSATRRPDRPEQSRNRRDPRAQGRSPRTARASSSQLRTSRVPRPARILAVVIAACVAAVVIAAANRPDGFARVIVLDVGQGDAILVEGGRGGRLLVDGGPDPDRLLVALDARLPPWDRRIDMLVLTHPHEDHVAGLALLLDRYRVGRTLEPGMIGPGPGYRAWQASLSAARAADRAGWRPAIGSASTRSGSRSSGLIPDAVPREPADGGTGINNVSIVLLGEVGRQRFLLAGRRRGGHRPDARSAAACRASTS